MEEMLMALRHFDHLLPAYTLATSTILPALAATFRNEISIAPISLFVAEQRHLLW